MSIKLDLLAVNCNSSSLDAFVSLVVAVLIMGCKLQNIPVNKCVIRQQSGSHWSAFHKHLLLG